MQNGRASQSKSKPIAQNYDTSDGTNGRGSVSGRLTYDIISRRGSFLNRIRMKQTSSISQKHDTTMLGPQGVMGDRAHAQFKENLQEW
jgi:hypothetical protein